MALTARAAAYFHEDADPLEWTMDAECRGEDVGIFYPEFAAPGGFAAAKAVCARCSVVPECLRAADREERDLPAAHLFGVRRA